MIHRSHEKVNYRIFRMRYKYLIYERFMSKIYAYVYSNV